MFLRITVFCTLVSLCGCAANVKTLSDKTGNFSQYKTFCWMDGCRFRFGGPVYFVDSVFRMEMEKRLHAALATKGLSLEKDTPDVLVGVTITLADRQQYFRGNPVVTHGPGDVLYDLKGTAVLAIADSRTGKMIYESTIFKFLEAGETVSDRKIRRVVNELLKDYPQNQKSSVTHQ